MEKITPYSDEKMLYNETTNQYELKLSWVKDNFGNNFSDDGVLEQRIKKNTRKVLNYIYSHSYGGNRKIINAIILHTEEYREFIYDALFSQMEADLNGGYNDQDLYVPQSREERDVQYLNQVSTGTQNILESSIGYGGINLLYMGCFNYLVYLEFMEFTK